MYQKRGFYIFFERLSGAALRLFLGSFYIAYGFFAWCDGFHYRIVPVLTEANPFSFCSRFDFLELLRIEPNYYLNAFAVCGGLVMRACCVFLNHTLSVSLSESDFKLVRYY